MRSGGSATLVAAAAFALWGACGGSARTETTTTPPPARSASADVPTEPVKVELAANRVGSALQVSVRAVGRGAREGAAFEDPDHWRISARQGGRDLERLVNGPVHVERAPAGVEQWDTEVRFSVAFQVDQSGGPVEVRAAPPRAGWVERSFNP